ncbi:conserved hypothetical protein [Thermocrinis albus DSM 14484]|uniref:Phosphatidic acid phosphatase type 2/haloperoxidase domain-containing protein n=1 Tax=Thermocrinis albus (strain DSM 14484 / JCM 11386 / HI 11/12) TaxID=638303 RepID=D3SNX9_THEAH|nr:phosphatase PAP2 family protein [Thermocrinis albus]ADC88866.1 conserved hypothetical protein [Thermocrinis albus DSM 14484]
MVFEDLPLNVELFYLINHSRHPLLDSFFSYFYLLGKGWVLLIPLSFLLLFQRKHLRTFLLTLSLETLLVEVLKTLTGQPRPASLLPDVYLIEPVYHRSFPSGDTAMAFMLACFFFLVLVHTEGCFCQCMLYS